MKNSVVEENYYVLSDLGGNCGRLGKSLFYFFYIIKKYWLNDGAHFLHHFFMSNVENFSS